MNNEFFDALSILEQEKGINVESLLEKITVAIENAVKKDFGPREHHNQHRPRNKKISGCYQKRGRF